MSKQPFPWRRTFVLGFGFFGISIVWPLFNSLVPPFLEDLGLTTIVIGFIMTWDNIINMFFQPWVGSRSDRTRMRFGRRKRCRVLTPQHVLNQKTEAEMPSRASI